MAIKSQQDIKNENKAKSDKIPKSMENKSEPVITTQNSEPDYIINERRITAIEVYLGKVDQAFEKVALEIGNLKEMAKILQVMDAEISKLTGDNIRNAKLNEDRYIELATAINAANEKITTLDTYIPIFIDKRIEEYFNAQNDEFTDEDLTEPEPAENQIV